MFALLGLCVSSLRRGHANLLRVVPIVTDDPRREPIVIMMLTYCYGLLGCYHIIRALVYSDIMLLGFIVWAHSWASLLPAGRDNSNSNSNSKSKSIVK